MALYRKFVRRGMITNKLIYRGHEFVERWEKDVVLMCKGDTISKQVNNTFDNLSVKELESIENLGFYTDFDLEEKISELSECEPFCLPMPLTEFYISRSEFEVVGSIFDNADLLEVE